MESRDLKEWTMRFALAAATLCRTTQHDWQGRRLADETVFWLEFAARAGMTGAPAAATVNEARAGLAIFIASQKTVAAKRRRS